MNLFALECFAETKSTGGKMKSGLTFLRIGVAGVCFRVVRVRQIGDTLTVSARKVGH